MNDRRGMCVARPSRPCTPRASGPWKPARRALDQRAPQGPGAPDTTTHGQDARATARGVALLEVVLALGLFVAAAATINAGVWASLRTARRIRADATASDLAVTVVSYLELGLLPLEDAGPEPFDDEDRPGWTWEVVTGPADESAEIEDGLLRVEVTVRHEQTGGRARQVHWLANPTANGEALP